MASIEAQRYREAADGHRDEVLRLSALLETCDESARPGYERRRDSSRAYWDRYAAMAAREEAK